MGVGEKVPIAGVGTGPDKNENILFLHKWYM